MASSSDAVRNFVYDVHRSNLTLGWKIVVQLTEAGVDSWERIYERFPVVNLNNGVEWDALDEQSVAALSLCCPLLGDKLAAQLAAQASLYTTGSLSGQQPLKRGNSLRVGSLRQRIDRLYLSEKPPSPPKHITNPSSKFNPLSRLVALTRGGGSKNKDPATPKKGSKNLVPFLEGVEQHSVAA